MGCSYSSTWEVGLGSQGGGLGSIGGTSQTVEKAVPCHFADTNSSEDDLVFAPFRRVRSNNPWVLRHLESNAINEYNLVEAGVNRILTCE